VPALSVSLPQLSIVCKEWSRSSDTLLMVGGGEAAMLCGVGEEVEDVLQLVITC
jgi:hypothetical protein